MRFAPTPARTNAFESANCIGRHIIFDSTDPETHGHAKALCGSCPAVAACERLRDEMLTSPALRIQAVGTWAGELLDPKAYWRERTANARRAKAKVA